MNKYAEISSHSLESSRVVVPLILDYLKPTSVIDLGCKHGEWLSTFRQHGVDDLQGFDRAVVEPYVIVKPTEFRAVDLSQPFTIDRRYDLAMCVEVAEHLPKAAAAPLVRALTGAADVVLFSAALEGQGGHGHRNEQPHEFWDKLFAQHGFHKIDCIRPKIWQDSRVAWWYRQNMFVYANDEGLERSEGLRAEFRRQPATDIQLIHREVLEHQTSLTTALSRLPQTAARALGKVRRRLGGSGRASAKRACGVLAMCLCAAPSIEAAPAAFKVATWNIRSGIGTAGFETRKKGTWRHNTLNCTDRSKPVNAWGMGLPQRELERLKADPAIVAVAVQEAWNCASPSKINAVLEFKTATREQNGVALFARHGLKGNPVYQRIGGTSSWLVGGAVCLDAACSAALPMFSTHWGASDQSEWPMYAQKAVDYLTGLSAPHLFMGDLNVYKVDQWNPLVPCTNKDSPGRAGAIAVIERSGYVDAWKATQDGAGWTGMASRRGCGVPEGNLYKRIDYVYASQLRVLKTEQFARTDPGADSPSDHVGVIAELAVAPSETR